MTTETLEQAIRPGVPVLLDSTALISYLDGTERTSPIAIHIVDAFIKSGRNPAYVSAVSAMEVLVRPLRTGPAPGMHAYNFLTRTHNLYVVDVDLPISHQAASLRATHQLKPVDALVTASGTMYGVEALVTNDAKWRRLPATIGAVCYLEAHLPFS